MKELGDLLLFEKFAKDGLYRASRIKIKHAVQKALRGERSFLQLTRHEESGSWAFSPLVRVYFGTNRVLHLGCHSIKGDARKAFMNWIGLKNSGKPLD